MSQNTQSIDDVLVIRVTFIILRKFGSCFAAPQSARRHSVTSSVEPRQLPRNRTMQSSDGVARDWVVALAWASAIGWLKLLVLAGQIAGKLQRTPAAEGEPADAGDACAKVSRLQRIAERGVWR